LACAMLCSLKTMKNVVSNYAIWLEIKQLW
jgi:hypothetical protein